MSSYCKVWINNQEIEADPERKLMEVLRDDLRLKSVKDGCSEGACGTCTVLVDGKATKACVQKMGRMEGKHILTVEGLSQREKDVYVYAFGEAGAVQCGFCIPGMVICAKALLDVNPDPSRVEAAFAIRCFEEHPEGHSAIRRSGKDPEEPLAVMLLLQPWEPGMMRCRSPGKRRQNRKRVRLYSLDRESSCFHSYAIPPLYPVIAVYSGAPAGGCIGPP